MKDPPPLWLAGGVLDKQYFKEIQKFVFEHQLDDKIKFLGLVSHERLSELYQSARAFIFPSTLEACPQTLIEAMASGVPIATSNIPPMPEICQQAAVYFDPSDPGEIAKKIEQLIMDPLLCVTLQKYASERIQFFSWDKSAEQLIRVFEKVIISTPTYN
jgi:glycosyltransferase involved in cell wall biosynthesis